MFDEPEHIREYYGYSTRDVLEELKHIPKGSHRRFTEEIIRATFPPLYDLEPLTERFDRFIDLCSEYELKVMREYDTGIFKVINPNTKL